MENRTDSFKLSVEERRAQMAKMAGYYCRQGWEITNEDSYNFIVSMKKITVNKVNHGLHIILSLLTGFLWLIPYIAILVFTSNKLMYSSFKIDEFGNTRDLQGKLLKSYSHE